MFTPTLGSYASRRMATTRLEDRQFNSDPTSSTTSQPTAQARGRGRFCGVDDRTGGQAQAPGQPLLVSVPDASSSSANQET
jgi:hypothetical protein